MDEEVILNQGESSQKEAEEDESEGSASRREKRLLAHVQRPRGRCAFQNKDLQTHCPRPDKKCKQTLMCVNRSDHVLNPKSPPDVQYAALIDAHKSLHPLVSLTLV